MFFLRFSLVLLLAVFNSFAVAQNLLIARLHNPAAAERVALRAKVKLVDTTNPAPFILLKVPAGANVSLVADKIRQDPNVVWVEDDGEVSMPEHQGGSKGSTIAAIGDREALYTENTQLLQQVHFSSVLALEPGRSVRIGVLDTGLSPYQPDLWAKVVASQNAIERDMPPYDLRRKQDSNGNKVPDEATGHGTMVAGLIDQFSPLCPLVVVRVADSDGYGTAWSLTKGIAFAIVNGVEVINISLGSSAQILALTDVMDWVEERNVLVVAAIGNDNQDLALYPSRISKVICVTGVDPNDRKASFSNWEGTADQAAPATGVKSFWWRGGLGIWSGTSFASPMVAATIADGLRKRAAPLLVDDLKDMVQDTGTNIDNLNPAFDGEIGLRLHYQALQNAIRSR